jgi:hypothetical protein
LVGLEMCVSNSMSLSHGVLIGLSNSHLCNDYDIVKVICQGGEWIVGLPIGCPYGQFNPAPPPPLENRYDEAG